MSRNVRLFPTYSQKENQTTNHCLLILKMLYEENPKFLSEALSILLEESFSGSVGVEFIQQKRDRNCVPDGEITQEPFSILIETKLGNDFHREQLERHIDTLKNNHGNKTLIALGNFEQENPVHPVFQEIAQLAEQKDISFVPVSFEQFLQSIQLDTLPKNLLDAVSDLGEYFDENSLLPSWKYRLDVVNCKISFDGVLQNKIYTCPAKGGQYSHRRSLYFGTYRNKCVERIAKIEAVVDFESESEQTLVWKNNGKSDKELIKIATERRHLAGDNWYGARVFILEDLFKTNFLKTSPGGMMGSKQYFDIEKLKINDAQGLADKLKDQTWEDY